MSWADLSFNAVRAELDIEPYLDILQGVLESYVDGPRVPVPGGQFATALVGNLVVRDGLTLKPAVEFSAAPFTSYDSPSPDELEKFDLAYGNQFKGVWGGVDLNGDGRGDMVFPAGGNDELFIQVFTDPRQERDYYIERVDVTRGWKIEAVRLLPTALHQAPFIGPANSSARVEWKVSRDPLAPDEAYATFKLVQDNARYLGLIDRTVDEINIKLWHTRAVADLDVRASGSPAAVGPGETVSYALAVTNDGADRAQDVTVTVEGLNRGGLVLAAARAGNRPLACDVHHSGDIATCGLGALDDGRTVAVALDFNPSFAFKTPESFAATVVFSASSPVYDPGVENNLAEVTTTFQPPAVPDCATGGAVRDAAANPGLAADCEILLAARDILGVGPTRLSWSVDTPINNWYDVTLGGTPQRVTGLNLSGYGLSGTIPPGLGGLTGLEYLDLGRNGLSGKIPGELGGLTNLQSLWLQGNQLTGCIPAGLREVPDHDLDELGLADCAPTTEVSISSGANHTCILKGAGSVECWGSNDHGQTTPPGSPSFTSISSGARHTCGLLEDGAPVCWGHNEHGQATPPAGEKFVSIAGGASHTCGLRADGTPVCWGKNTDRYGGFSGQATPPSGEKFVSISGGADHTCGLRANGTLRCWGWRSFGANTPPNVSDVESLSDHSYFNTCAIRESGAAICWGHNNWGQATPPVGVTFSSITSGDVHTCGLQPSGAVRCWGSNYRYNGSPFYGQATPPEGEKFSAISAGYNHTCGLTADGRVVCWGDNAHGQSTPPSALGNNAEASTLFARNPAGVFPEER